MIKNYANDILAGNIRALSKAITLTESKKVEHQEASEKLIDEILPHTGKSIRIGISGTPGAGKSTFIESLGISLTASGRKVAVLAIDPSSPVSGGSILGDKTRMEKLSQDPNAYIRPTPNSGTLGGIAQKTREAILLCEAAGFDVVLIETVGVGQSEFQVSEMVDFFAVLLIPGGGDELQGIKKGIIEIADIILINKCDGNNEKRALTTQREYLSALHIISNEKEWSTKVETTSALEGHGIKNFWNIVESFQEITKKSGSFERKRSMQKNKWLNSLFFELIKNKVANDSQLQQMWLESESKIEANTSTPLSEAKLILNLLFQNN